MSLSRRELLSATIGPVAATLAGCGGGESRRSGRLPTAGELFSPDFQTGHRIRDGMGASPGPSDRPLRRVRCLIVGGGIAGLSAAWSLSRDGMDDYEVIELENVPGGTSRSGRSAGAGGTSDFHYPWGAHYVPVPMPQNLPLIEFLTSIGVVESSGEHRVVIAEQHLCRDPSERIFAEGRWEQGLYPSRLATQEDLKQLDRFRGEMTRWAMRRGRDGKRLFMIPASMMSTDESTRSLDNLSMRQWMDERGFDSEPLRWSVDHACRDDYGLTSGQTSAWAGIFYFAARIADESGESQAVMTWPNGNGFLTERLARSAGQRLRLGHAATRFEVPDQNGLSRVTILNTTTLEFESLLADRVILALPQFIGRRLVPQELSDPPIDLTQLHYGSWLVANVHLSDRPKETGFPSCWDNVIYGSHSLGYVTSTHQAGNDYGSTVWTWYQALTSDDANADRRKLLSLTWAELAEVVLSDLEIAHPEIRDLVTRLDVMRWGHAMIGPRVGDVFGVDREALRQPIGPFHFAATDLSGVALFEEAFDHGVRAGGEVLRSLQRLR